MGLDRVFPIVRTKNNWMLLETVRTYDHEAPTPRFRDQRAKKVREIWSSVV